MSLSARLGSGDDPVVPLTRVQLSARNRVQAHLSAGRYLLEDAPCLCQAGRGASSGESESLVVAQRDRYGLDVRTVLCTRCGLLRTSPRMNAQSTAAFYQDDYRDLYSGAIAKEALFNGEVQRGRRIYAALAKLLPQIERVYEVGCGGGGILLPFARSGRHVAGCDLGDDYLAIGRSQGLNLISGDIDALVSDQGHRADLIILSHVLEHFLDPVAEVVKIGAALRPGGWLLVEVPGIESIRSGYGGDFLRYLQNAHTYHFSAKTLEQTLCAARLETCYVDESAFALARCPVDKDRSDSALRAARAPKSTDEPRRILRFLAETERQWLRAQH